jgi:hypothetical protein
VKPGSILAHRIGPRREPRQQAVKADLDGVDKA